MPRSERETHISSLALALLFIKAMALGVLCAGAVLLDWQIDVPAVVDVRHFWLSRLIFLLASGLSFGLGVTFARIL